MNEAATTIVPTGDRRPVQANTDPDLQYTPACSPIGELIRLMATVDTTAKEAKLNEVSMSDNNGGRIWF